MNILAFKFLELPWSDACSMHLAYVGPGAGLTAIGAAIALVLGVLLTLLGFVWYPLKRIFKALRGRKTDVNMERTTRTDEKSVETNP